MASGSHTQNVQSTVASASVGVANVARNGRRMKTDPAWEHGVTIDDDSRRVRCNYCKTDFTGGAYRLKLHLAGTSKDVRSCDSVPDDVKKTMEDIVDGLRIRKKKSIGNECDVAEAEVAANSNGKRKNVREIARKDVSKRVEDSHSMASKTESESPTDTPPSPPKNVYKDPDDGRQRFLLELEFVQCLANPTYIHYLAQNRYFEDEAFIGYLKYLQYWQRPEYIKFIMYPHCLYFLELLQNANFRNAMAHPTNKELAHRQQFYFWKNYRNNRLKHILPKPLPEPTAALPASTQPQPPVPALPPPPPPPAATNVAVTTSSTQAPSPMPYGSGLAKNDPRNPTVDRRKRK